MTEQETPSVEEIKARLKVEIPVEEEAPKKGAGDVTEELKMLGRQFAETLQSAWNSEERHRVESQVREGMKSFAGEIDKVIREVKESPAAAKVKEEAEQLKARTESAEFSHKARKGVSQGLQWLSEELGKLADQFTAAEKSPDGSGAEDETA